MLNRNNIPLGDQLKARASSVGSSLVHTVSSVQKLVGVTDPLANTRVHWRYNGMAVKEVGNWVEVEANLSSANNTDDGGEAVILGVDTQVLNQLEAMAQPCRPAVAYAIGEAVVVGELPDGFDFKRDDKVALVGMHVGESLLRASVGIRRESSGEFVPAGTPQLMGRMETAQLPDSIPLV